MTGLSKDELTVPFLSLLVSPLNPMSNRLCLAFDLGLIEVG